MSLPIVFCIVGIDTQSLLATRVAHTVGSPAALPLHGWLSLAYADHRVVPVALLTDGVPYSMLWAAWEAIAHCPHLERERFGSLGKAADRAVLAEDPLTCDMNRLKDIRIEQTFLAGPWADLP